MVAAIAWIGSSFDLVFLDSSLTPPADERLRRDGATGERWAVHGGGFYHPVKYAVAPPRLPERLLAWLAASMAGAAAVAFLVVFWLLYDAICRWWGQTPGGDRKVGLAAALQAGAAGDTPVAHVEPAQALAVVQQRCVPCHGEALASKGVRLDSAPALAQHAPAVYQQVVVTRQMPINNATGLTEAERALIAAWWRAGAPVP